MNSALEYMRLFNDQPAKMIELLNEFLQVKGLNILNEGIKILNNYLQIKENLLYFDKMFNKYLDGTGESDELCSSKPIDTDYISNLEWENRKSLKTENQQSLAVD